MDLALVHRPCQPKQTKDAKAANNALWKGMQMALKMGLTRAIGVSNYAHTDLEALDQTVIPSVNQCQMSIKTHDDTTIAYCTLPLAHCILRIVRSLRPTVYCVRHIHRLLYAPFGPLYIAYESLELRKSRRVDPNQSLDKKFRPVKFCQKNSESSIGKSLFLKKFERLITFLLGLSSEKVIWSFYFGRFFIECRIYNRQKAVASKRRAPVQFQLATYICLLGCSHHTFCMG